MVCFACFTDFISHAAVPKVLSPRMSWHWKSVLRQQGHVLAPLAGHRGQMNSYAWTATLVPQANTDLCMENSAEGVGWTRGCPILPSSHGALLECKLQCSWEKQAKLCTTASLRPHSRELAAEEPAENSGTANDNIGFGSTHLRAAFLPTLCIPTPRTCQTWKGSQATPPDSSVLQ